MSDYEAWEGKVECTQQWVADYRLAHGIDDWEKYLDDHYYEIMVIDGVVWLIKAKETGIQEEFMEMSEYDGTFRCQFYSGSNNLKEMLMEALV